MERLAPTVQTVQAHIGEKLEDDLQERLGEKLEKPKQQFEVHGSGQRSLRREDVKAFCDPSGRI